jgi:hypothetical protein
MLQYEITRKQLLEKQQKKIDALEARAAELRKQKAEHEKAWAAAQRERELQKVGFAAQSPTACVTSCVPHFEALWGMGGRPCQWHGAPKCLVLILQPNFAV